MQQRIFGLENEYGLIFSPNGKIYLPMEKVLGYIFEGLIPNSWPSNAFLVNGARFYQDTGCHPEYSTPESASAISRTTPPRRDASAAAAVSNSLIETLSPSSTSAG